MAMRPTGALNTAQNLRVVTPHASENLPDGPCRALWVNDDGKVTVAVIAEGDSVAIPMTVIGPFRIDVATKAVRTSGTTATSIVAMY